MRGSEVLLDHAVICIVGHGRAGSIHANALLRAGADVIVVDPKCRIDPATQVTSFEQIDEVWSCVRPDVWLVATPTPDHFSTVKLICERDERARVIVEKPACSSREIAAFDAFLGQNDPARVVVVDQYRYSKAFEAMHRLLQAADLRIDDAEHVLIDFSKDRRPDSLAGRFVDEDFGIIGYEWPHMVAVLERTQPRCVYDMHEVVAIEAALDDDGHVEAIAERSMFDTMRVTMRASIAGAIASEALDRELIVRPTPRDPFRTVFVAWPDGDTQLQIVFDGVRDGAGPRSLIGRLGHIVALRQRHDGELRTVHHVIRERSLEACNPHIVSGLLTGAISSNINTRVLREMKRLADAVRETSS